MAQEYKGIIFDFNGTLFFDTPMHERAWREYTAKICKREITDEEFCNSIHGRTNAEILRYFFGNGISDEEINEHSEAKETIYRNICLSDEDSFHLADGAENFLDMLSSKGIPMAVATSSGRTNSEFYIEHFGMRRWFDREHFIYNDGSYRSKPHPDIYLAAIQRLGLNPQECLVFEDMPSGIASAELAGVGGIIAVASALSKDFLISLSGVTHVIKNYEEFINQ